MCIHCGYDDGSFNSFCEISFVNQEAKVALKSNSEYKLWAKPFRNKAIVNLLAFFLRFSLSCPTFTLHILLEKNRLVNAESCLLHAKDLIAVLDKLTSPSIWLGNVEVVGFNWQQ
jgi:hypothetical protein